MIIGISHSINGVPIRLTDERWEHILDLHPELGAFRDTLLDAVENPNYILASRRGAFAAVVVLGRRLFFTSSTLKRADEMDSFFLPTSKRK